MPIQVDFETDSGEQRKLIIRRHDMPVQLHIKLKIMAKAPRLFEQDDPHWQVLNPAGEETEQPNLAEELFENVAKQQSGRGGQR